jgi:hypothetical protein
MELSFGCEVRETLSGELFIVLGRYARNRKYEVYDVLNPKSGGVHESALMSHEIIGHTPQLQDWLEVLQSRSDGWTAARVDSYGNLDVGNGIRWENDVLRFDLTTGQPKTDEDWDALAELLKAE